MPVQYTGAVRSRAHLRPRRARSSGCSPGGASDDVFAESLRRREGAPEWVFYEGPAHRQRPPGHPPRLGPALQGPLPPVPHDARAATSPARAAGTATASRSRSRSRRSSASPTSTRSRTSASTRSTAVPRVGAALRRGLVERSPPASACGSTPTTPTGRSTNDYIESVWWLFRQMWDAGDIYEGHKVVPYCGRCGTALSSHELGQPGAYRTSPSRRSTCASRSSTATSTCSCGRPRRGRWSRTSRAAVGPDDRVRAGARRGTADATSCSRRRASPTCSATTPRSSAPVAGRRARRPALRAPVRRTCRSTTADARACRRRRLRDRRRRLRHRAPRARVRRDRPRGRRARRPPDAQPGRARRRRSSTRPHARDSS